MRPARPYQQQAQLSRNKAMILHSTLLNITVKPVLDQCASLWRSSPRHSKTTKALAALFLLLAPFLFTSATLAQTIPPPPGAAIPLDGGDQQLSVGAQQTQNTVPNKPYDDAKGITSLIQQAAEQNTQQTITNTNDKLLQGSELAQYNETYAGIKAFWGDDIISNFFANIGQVIGRWLTELINGWIADTVQFLTAFLRTFVLNPNIAVNGLNTNPHGAGNPKNDDISPYIRAGADTMYGIAVDLLLLLFILTIWKYWADAAWRGGAGLMGAVGRLIFTAGLLLAWPTIYAFEIQITNEMIKAIYFNSADQIVMLDAAMAATVKGGLVAGAGLLANTFAPIIGAVAGGGIGGGTGGMVLGTVGGIVAFVGLMIYLVLGGILIAELVYILVLKAIQTALLTAQYMFAPIFIVFFASPDTENVCSGFVKSFIEVSLWTFVWVGLLKIMVIILFSDFNPWGKIVMAVGVLQLMIQTPSFMARAQISPMSDFISAGLVAGGLTKGLSALGDVAQTRTAQLFKYGTSDKYAARGLEQSQKVGLNKLSQTAMNPELVKSLKDAQSGKDGKGNPPLGPDGLPIKPPTPTTGPKGATPPEKKDPNAKDKDKNKSGNVPVTGKDLKTAEDEKNKKDAADAQKPGPRKLGLGTGTLAASTQGQQMSPPGAQKPGQKDGGTGSASQTNLNAGLGGATAAQRLANAGKAGAVIAGGAAALSALGAAAQLRNGSDQSDQARKQEEARKNAEAQAMNAQKAANDLKAHGSETEEEKKKNAAEAAQAALQPPAVKQTLQQDGQPQPGDKKLSEEDKKAKAEAAAQAALQPPAVKPTAQSAQPAHTGDKKLLTEQEKKARAEAAALAALGVGAITAGRQNPNPGTTETKGGTASSSSTAVPKAEPIVTAGTPKFGASTKPEQSNVAGAAIPPIKPLDAAKTAEDAAKKGNPEGHKDAALNQGQQGTGQTLNMAPVDHEHEHDGKQEVGKDGAGASLKQPIQVRPVLPGAFAPPSPKKDLSAGAAPDQTVGSTRGNTGSSAQSSITGTPKAEPIATSGAAKVGLPTTPGQSIVTGAVPPISALDAAKAAQDVADKGNLGGSKAALNQNQPGTSQTLNMAQTDHETGVSNDKPEAGKDGAAAASLKQQLQGRPVLPGAFAPGAKRELSASAADKSIAGGKGTGATPTDKNTVSSEPPSSLVVKTGSTSSPILPNGVNPTTGGTPVVTPDGKGVVAHGTGSGAPNSLPVSDIEMPAEDGTFVPGFDAQGRPVTINVTSRPGATRQSGASRPGTVQGIVQSGVQPPLQQPANTAAQSTPIVPGRGPGADAVNPGAAASGVAAHLVGQSLNPAAIAQGRHIDPSTAIIPEQLQENLGGDSGGGTGAPPSGLGAAAPTPFEKFRQSNYGGVPPRNMAIDIRTAKGPTMGPATDGKATLVGNSKGFVNHVRFGADATPVQQALQVIAAGYAQTFSSDSQAFDAAREAAIEAKEDGPQGMFERAAAGFMAYNGSSFKQTAVAKQRFQKALFKHAALGAEAYVNGQDGNAFTDHLKGRYDEMTPDRQAWLVHTMTDDSSPESGWNPKVVTATDTLMSTGNPISNSLRAAASNTSVLKEAGWRRGPAVLGVAAYSESKVDRQTGANKPHYMVTDALVSRTASNASGPEVGACTAIMLESPNLEAGKAACADVEMVNAVAQLVAGEHQQDYVSAYRSLSGMISHLSGGQGDNRVSTAQSITMAAPSGGGQQSGGLSIGGFSSAGGASRQQHNNVDVGLSDNGGSAAMSPLVNPPLPPMNPPLRQQTDIIYRNQGAGGFTTTRQAIDMPIAGTPGQQDTRIVGSGAGPAPVQRTELDVNGRVVGGSQPPANQSLPPSNPSLRQQTDLTYRDDQRGGGFSTTRQSVDMPVSGTPGQQDTRIVGSGAGPASVQRTELDVNARVIGGSQQPGLPPINAIPPNQHQVRQTIDFNIRPSGGQGASTSSNLSMNFNVDTEISSGNPDVRILGNAGSGQSLIDQQFVEAYGTSSDSGQSTNPADLASVAQTAAAGSKNHLYTAQQIIMEMHSAGFTDDQIQDPRIAQSALDVWREEPSMLATASITARIMGPSEFNRGTTQVVQQMIDSGWSANNISRPDVYTAQSIMSSGSAPPTRQYVQTVRMLPEYNPRPNTMLPPQFAAEAQRTQQTGGFDDWLRSMSGGNR